MVWRAGPVQSSLALPENGMSPALLEGVDTMLNLGYPNPAMPAVPVIKVGTESLTHICLLVLSRWPNALL
jgi:hypothetical protein